MIKSNQIISTRTITSSEKSTSDSCDISLKGIVSVMAVSKGASPRVFTTIAFGDKFGSKFLNNFKRICNKQTNKFGNMLQE